ncbi:hypothetical protein ACFE04_017266 [Oxalis oulophora]
MLFTVPCFLEKVSPSQKCFHFKLDLLSSFILCSTILILSYLLKILWFKNHSELPPSPPKLPLIGNLHQLGKLPHRSFHALSAIYGPIMFLQSGKVPTIVVSSSEIVKQILKHHDIEFSNRPNVRAAQTFFYGATDVGFASYSEYWKQLKKIIVTHFLSTKKVQSFKLLMEQEIADMIDTLRVKDGASAINLGEMLRNVTANVVSRATMSRKFDEHISFGETAKIAAEILGEFCFRDFFPSLGLLDYLTGFESRLKQTSKRLDAYLEHIIEERKDHISKSEFYDHDHKDFMDVLLDGSLGGNIDLTPDNIKANIFEVFLGGTGTTSTTVEWAMAELVKNPNTMTRVQEEVRRMVGNKTRIEENDIASMVYLKCVIKETLRLHPPAPLLVPRESPSSESIRLGGYDIPPKTRVYINAWAIHMDKNVWHDPDQFKPERFLDRDVDFTGNDGAYMPFGIGRRRCPGINFAMVQTEIALANLLYWFDWKLPPGEYVEIFDMSETLGLVVHKTKPLYLSPQHYHAA